MIIQKIDANLLAYALRTRCLPLPLTAFKSEVFATAKENPMYRPRSTYSAYLLPRSSVYGNHGPNRYQSGPCGGTCGPYQPERIAAVRKYIA